MAEQSDGKKQETPERRLERWIMMMREEGEEGEEGSDWTTSRSKSNKKAAQRKGVELKESRAIGWCGQWRAQGQGPTLPCPLLIEN